MTPRQSDCLLRDGADRRNIGPVHIIQILYQVHHIRTTIAIGVGEQTIVHGIASAIRHINIQERIT